jgi:hypothetical protein
MNNKTWTIIAAIFCIGFVVVTVVWATTFSYTYDTATPAGSDDPAEADDRMREIKAAIQERMNVCMYWPLTGTEVSDADAGEVRKILFHEPIAATPTVAANHGDLRVKDVGSKAELTWTDEDENELVLTSKGNNLANNTYLTATNAAGTGSVNLIKADANDVVYLPENTVLAYSVTPDANDEIVNKKYVDDQDTADHPAYSGGESHTDGSGMIIKQGTVNASANSSATETFATAFPSACTRVVISPTIVSTEATLGGLVWVRTKSKTAITVFNSVDVTVAVDWIAIGY